MEAFAPALFPGEDQTQAGAVVVGPWKDFPATFGPLSSIHSDESLSLRISVFRGEASGYLWHCPVALLAAAKGPAQRPEAWTVDRAFPSQAKVHMLLLLLLHLLVSWLLQWC